MVAGTVVFHGPPGCPGTRTADWGRVLGSGAVAKAVTDSAGRSSVEVDWEFTGGEFPETSFRVRRDVWSDDPKDLSAPLHYEVEVTEGLALLVARPPGQAAVLDAIVSRAGRRLTRAELQELTDLSEKTVRNATIALADRS